MKALGIWNSMRTRCFNPKNRAYPNYGGRGITVCDRWKHFKNFLEDMGEPPAGMLLDRVDNNGNYELSNCRWATRVEQNSNRRNVVLMDFRGSKVAVTEAMRRANSLAPYSSVKARLRRGWTLEMAVTTPVLSKEELTIRQRAAAIKTHAARRTKQGDCNV